jgi:methylated-DNA-protein-cysteine methyltransferase related protein
MPSIKAQIIEIVNKIPAGKVMYFGQIGKLIVNKNQEQSLVDGFTGVTGQVVGFVLSGMPQAEWSLLPWHRVVAKDGYISSLKLGAKGLIQKQLLLDEGVSIFEDHVDMARHLFEPNKAEFLF